MFRIIEDSNPQSASALKSGETRHVIAIEGDAQAMARFVHDFHGALRTFKYLGAKSIKEETNTALSNKKKATIDQYTTCLESIATLLEALHQQQLEPK